MSVKSSTEATEYTFGEYWGISYQNRDLDSPIGSIPPNASSVLFKHGQTSNQAAIGQTITSLASQIGQVGGSHVGVDQIGVDQIGVGQSRDGQNIACQIGDGQAKNSQTIRNNGDQSYGQNHYGTRPGNHGQAFGQNYYGQHNRGSGFGHNNYGPVNYQNNNGPRQG
ncbi:RNA-binding protein 3-like [Tripterygium wilfordii]|uniref:RNA-binding protein 3-like n=1 Tax=Tripterygium wilfordii TaxID=458696 RepID=UPI0018F82D07|nr:RNA-binding protein 3-like [Tripterygium wilfordii]